MVLTNGIFELLHVGHLRYLREARRHGEQNAERTNEHKIPRFGRGDYPRMGVRRGADAGR